MRSPRCIRTVNPSISVVPPRVTLMSCSSRMVPPRRSVSNSSRVSARFTGAAVSIASCAREMRAFCFVERADGERRSHSTSVRRKFCRLASVRASISSRWDLASRYALQPPL